MSYSAIAARRVAQSSLAISPVLTRIGRNLSRGLTGSLLNHRILAQTSPALSLLLSPRYLQTEASKSANQKPQAKVPSAVDGKLDRVDVPLVKTKDDRVPEKTAQKEVEAKLTLWQKVKHEAHHYWDGTKLLATEVRISTRLAIKMAAGYELSRREHRQLRRTVQDLARLVPFSVFVIVPFAELLLPFALKLFPGLLPSTYEAQKSKDAKASTLRATRQEVSQFLRMTLRETGLPVTIATAQKEEFATFFRKIRATGEVPTEDDVIKVCKIFRDDLTLDNLSRPQLVSMCRYLNLSTFGTDMMLRYQVRHRMRKIKRDDRAIYDEGISNLTVGELQTACATRGIRSYGVSPATMREDLQKWLDLRLKGGVPSTLLVLSNAYMYSGESTSQMEALTGVLSSIPQELFHEIELEVHNAEGAATNKQRLEVIKEQQELIDEENEQNEENETSGVVSPPDHENIDEEKENAEAKSADGEVSEDVKPSSEGDAPAQEAQLQEARPTEATGEAPGSESKPAPKE